MLSISNLSVVIEDACILKKLSFSMNNGEIHTIMGPNGSGKSTLAHTIMGSSYCVVSDGKIAFNGESLLELSLHERALKGVFLSYQQPPTIPGLSVFSLLKEIKRVHVQGTFDLHAFQAELNEYCTLLKIDPSFLSRSCNDGFSGGEKKRLELLQMLIARPKLLILDEIDSGLDIDALKLVAQVIAVLKAENPDMMILIITHYKRILEYIVPDYVHVLVQGQLCDSGTLALLSALEQKGYDGYLKRA